MDNNTYNEINFHIDELVKYTKNAMNCYYKIKYLESIGSPTELYKHRMKDSYSKAAKERYNINKILRRT